MGGDGWVGDVWVVMCEWVHACTCVCVCGGREEGRKGEG